ncbi:hypothetical protein AAFC00_006234 [Neodothiora populina]|uniref:C3H1-type domain-containing protein n=1 Tax=Neodothiora populina TaxID=2781224 RepID=A0ABR3P5A0_9PEZI
MSGFSFPPPPPPPPKATSSQQPELVQGSFRGGRGGRGGGRGDGRGTGRGRGGQNQRGGRPQQPYQSHAHSNQAYQTGANSFPVNQRGGAANVQSMHGDYSQNYAIPPGAYVNPAFNPLQTQGVQPPQQSHGYSAQQYASNQSSSSSPGGNKRTREQAFGGPAQRHHPMKKPQSAPKVPAAPAVPSFGAPLPLPPKATPATATAQIVASKADPKKRISLFGLTSEGGVADDTKQEESEGEDEEDDVDEEASYAANLSNGPLTIEYNGETRNLSSPAELADWLNERKRFYPTKQRIEEKKTEVRTRMEERKRIQQETRAAAAAADPTSSLAKSLPGKRERPQHREAERGLKGRRGAGPEQGGSGTPEVSSKDDARRLLELKMFEVQELQKKLAESEARAAAAASSKQEAGEKQLEAEIHKHAVAKDSTTTAVDPVVSVVSPEVDVNMTTEANSVDPLQALEAALSAPTDPATATHPTSSEPALEPSHPHDTNLDQLTNPQELNNNDNSSLPRPISAASPPAPSSNSDSSDSSDTDSSDSDSAPEQTSSHGTGPIRVAAPNSSKPICNAFATTGNCRFGPKCRFRHVATEHTRQARSNAVTNDGGSGGVGGSSGRRGEKAGKARTTLFQRMVEQEKEKENALALGAIKFLGQVGFFRSAAPVTQEQKQQQSSS